MDDLFLSHEMVEIITDIMYNCDAPSYEKRDWYITFNSNEIKIFENGYQVADNIYETLLLIPINDFRSILYDSNIYEECKQKILRNISIQSNIMLNTKLITKRMENIEENINQLNDKLQILIDILNCLKIIN